jgi:hypothetical protein
VTQTFPYQSRFPINVQAGWDKKSRAHLGQSGSTRHQARQQAGIAMAIGGSVYSFTSGRIPFSDDELSEAPTREIEQR